MTDRKIMQLIAPTRDYFAVFLLDADTALYVKVEYIAVCEGGFVSAVIMDGGKLVTAEKASRLHEIKDYCGVFCWVDLQSMGVVSDMPIGCSGQIKAFKKEEGFDFSGISIMV